MDPAVVGGLIGVSFLVCFLLSGVCYEKAFQFYERWKLPKKVHSPLLPMSVKKQNPLFLSSGSKSFQIKELLTPT